MTSNTMTRTPSPVDNATYNLLQALTSKLEAIEAYNKYAADSGAGAELFERMAREDAEHAKELVSQLRKQLSS
jgi:rubrerythrin